MLIPEEKVRLFKTKEQRESYNQSVSDFNKKNKSFGKLSRANKKPMKIPEQSEKKYGSNAKKNSFVSRIRQKTADNREPIIA